MDENKPINHKNYFDYCIFVLTKNNDLKNVMIKYLQHFNINNKNYDNNDICKMLYQQFAKNNDIRPT